MIRGSYYESSERTRMEVLFGKKNDGRESARLTKFRTPSGWFMRHVAQQGSSYFSFIHFFSGDSKKGLSSNVIKDFLLIHKYE